MKDYYDDLDSEDEYREAGWEIKEDSMHLSEAQVNRWKEFARNGSPVGDFKPEYCLGIIRWCSMGKVPKAYAAAIGVSSDTLIRWSKRIPEFGQAVSEARTLFFAYWSEVTMLSAKGVIKGNSTMLTVFLKNNFPEDYGDPEQRSNTNASAVTYISTGIPHEDQDQDVKYLQYTSDDEEEVVEEENEDDEDDDEDL